MTYLEPWLFLALAMAGFGLYRVVRRQPGASLWPVTLGVAGVFVISWPPLAWLFAQPLERMYPARSLDPQVEAIVVLSGNAYLPTSTHAYPVLAEDTYWHCLAAAKLYKEWQPRPILVSGGAVAPMMRHVIESEGVPRTAITEEHASTDTHQNAVFSARILLESGISIIALVTDARDMPRATACFRKEGLVVMPVPCRFEEFGTGAGFFLPGGKAIVTNGRTLHETLGFLWYALRGWV